MADSPDQTNDPGHVAYWRANIKILWYLVGAWFLVSFGMSILAVDWLDQFSFMGFPFGFWMAQQGAIICFVILLVIYAIGMNRLDAKYGYREDNK